MKFTRENCECVLDAADALLTTLSARGTVFQSASDIDAEKIAMEAFRQAFIQGGFTSGIIPGSGPGELPGHFYMQIQALWEQLKALHAMPDLQPSRVRFEQMWVAGTRSMLADLATLEQPVKQPETSLPPPSKTSNIGKQGREKILEFFQGNPKPEWKNLDEIKEVIDSTSDDVAWRHLRQLVKGKRLESRKGEGLWRLLK